MAPRRLRRADMHLEAVPLAELAGTGARAKGESHRLCIFANANMVATPSRLARTIMTVGTTGETAATRRTAGACTPGVNASADEKAAAITSRRKNGMGNPSRNPEQSAIPIELKNGRYTNRVRPFSPEKRGVMTWMEKPGRHVTTVSNAPSRPFSLRQIRTDFSTTTWRRALHSHDSMTKWRITAAMGSRHTGQL